MKYLDKLEEAKIDKGKSYAEKTRARAKRAFDADYEDKKTSGEGKAGKMMRSKSFRKTMVMAARARRKRGDPQQPLAKQVEVEKKIKESYTMLGHILAEAMSIPKSTVPANQTFPVDSSPEGEKLRQSRTAAERELRDRTAAESKRLSPVAARLRSQGSRASFSTPETRVIKDNPDLLKRLRQ